MNLNSIITNLFILYLFFSQSLPHLFDSKFCIILARGSALQGIMRLHNLEKPRLLLWVISDSKFKRLTTLHSVKYQKKLWVLFLNALRDVPIFILFENVENNFFHFQFSASFWKYFHRKRFRELKQTYFLFSLKMKTENGQTKRPLTIFRISKT